MKEARAPFMIDVAICGAGPAGSIAALVLARAGARVMVFDRAVFPRDKLCGDTLNPGALAILDRLGLTCAAATGLPIYGMVVTGEGDLRIEGTYGDGACGRALTRRVLDQALLTAASAAGAQVEEGVLVRGPLLDSSSSAPRVTGLAVLGRAGPVRVKARVVVAADGRHSRVARELGLARHPPTPRRWAVGGYFDGVAGLRMFGEMHVRRGRYIGLAPLPGGLANVCVVTADRTSLADPPTFLMRAVREEPMLAERLEAATLVAPAVCMGPMAVECATPGAPGLLLAGDAAGFIDPMTGDGMRFALRGGELAAEAALHALQHGAAESHLRLMSACRREFAAKWRFNRALRMLVGSAVTVRLAGLGASIAPRVIQQAIRYAGDLRAV